MDGETGAAVGTVTHNTTHTNVGTYNDMLSFAGANYVNIGATAITNRIKDTTAPVIAGISNNAPTLWPPNHKMVAVTVSATASDLAGVTSLKIISVTSSEPDNGLGDGDTAGDIVITGPLTVNLRAERSGKGNAAITPLRWKRATRPPTRRRGPRRSSCQTARASKDGQGRTSVRPSQKTVT